LGGAFYRGGARRRRGVHDTNTGTAARRTSASPVQDRLRLGSDGLRGRARGRAGGSDWLGQGDKWAKGKVAVNERM
jgi:hypothetical protein